MARVEYGDRIGKTAPLRVGSAAVIGCISGWGRVFALGAPRAELPPNRYAPAVIFDETGEKVLLTRREDNGEWCLPGGAMESGESAEEACVREVWEETGLTVEVTRLIGIYTTPHRITVYKDGNRFQFVSFCFEARVIAGTPGLSDEVTDIGYFSRAEMATMKIIDPHHIRIEDAFARQVAAFVR